MSNKALHVIIARKKLTLRKHDLYIFNIFLVKLVFLFVSQLVTEFVSLSFLLFVYAPAYIYRAPGDIE